MPLYNIAGFVIEFSGFKNEFFNKRLEGYGIKKDALPDMTVEFTADGFKPKGKLEAMMDGFRQYYTMPEGYGIFDLLKAPDNYCA